MKYNIIKIIRIISVIAPVLFFTSVILSCGTSRTSRLIIPADTLFTNQQGQGTTLAFRFERGKAHNHPLMALWIEDTSGNYLETLFVAESIARGVFGHGDQSTGKWLPGPIRRPAALPVWAHSRGIRANDGYYIPSADNPMPDAVTGATPPGDFIIFTKLSPEIPRIIDVYFEINQSWDWNEYWTNDKYPGDENYQASCQPALIYRSRIDTSQKSVWTRLDLIGHGHYAGENGKIYNDLSTITTAKEIAKSAEVSIR